MLDELGISNEQLERIKNKEKRIMAVDRGAERRSEILGLLRFNTLVVERENGAYL